MADATQTDAKKAEASSTSASQSGAAQTPANEKLAATLPETVPYSRFKEVVELKNSKDDQIKELTSRLSALENKPTSTAPVDPVRQELAEIKAQLSTVLSANKEKPMEEFTSSFRKETKDYDALEPRMLELFHGMSKSRQAAVINDPEAFKDLYYRAKVESLEKGIEGKVQEGAASAYQVKGLKQALSSTSGAVAATDGMVLNKENIGKLDMSKPADKKFFLDHKADIMRLMGEGKL